MNPQVWHISGENFEKEVLGEKKPILLMCMPIDYDFGHQVDLLKRISVLYGEYLKVGLLDEACISRFKRKYNVRGTPTFIVLHEGEEQDRSLGLADEQMLMALISPFVGHGRETLSGI